MTATAATLEARDSPKVGTIHDVFADLRPPKYLRARKLARLRRSSSESTGSSAVCMWLSSATCGRVPVSLAHALRRDPSTKQDYALIRICGVLQTVYIARLRVSKPFRN